MSFLGDINGTDDNAESLNSGEKASETLQPAAFDSQDDASNVMDEEPFVLSSLEPESLGETARRSGLAWSAGVAFFASVVFMLVLGWGADLLLGSSPWGIVGGIVLGSLIGFVQLFRLSSQIFKK